MHEENKRENEVSILNWMGTLILCAIPGVNLIALFIWAFGSKKPSKRHYAIAALVITLLLFLLFFAAVALMGDQIIAALDALSAQLAALNAPPVAP